MATLIKAVKVSNAVNSVTKLLTNLSLTKSIASPSHAHLRRIPTFHRCALMHTTARRYGLMEFFDQEKNWTKKQVQVGRHWKSDELRIKSNEELHKLWYILLKERNMLLTMEHACNKNFELFPNPERLDKVEMSMKNLETVVRERNEAYYQLETGESGEQPAYYVYNILGMKQYYKLRQHLIPKYLNTKWKLKHPFGYNGYAVRRFQRLYREKLWNEKRKVRSRQKNAATTLIRKFPNLDLEALQEQCPLVDVQKLLKSNRLRYLQMRSRRL